MFGIILDLDFQHPGTLIQVVLSARAADAFQPPLSYNPDRVAGILDRTCWDIQQLQAVSVRNQQTGALEPAHVCALVHL